MREKSSSTYIRNAVLQSIFDITMNLRFLDIFDTCNSPINDYIILRYSCQLVHYVSLIDN